MTRRIVVGVILAAIGLGCVYLPWSFSLLILVVGLLSLYEMNQLCEAKGQPIEFPIAVIGVFGYIFLAAFNLSHKWEGVLLASITIAAFWIGMYGEQIGYFARTAYTLLSVLYIGKLLSYFIFIRAIPDNGLYWTVYVIVMIALTDIFGMLIGSLIGRTQLTKISPKKTVEGSVGALLVVTGAAAALAAAFPPLHLLWWEGALLGFGTSIAAQAGDLVESALKRDAGVKDSGELIQGHGGVLDRFDSYLFGGTAFFGILHLLGLVAVQ